MTRPARASKATNQQHEDSKADTVEGSRVIKKYPNRRLYDTQNSSYITLAEVKKMVMSGESFKVFDAKTGDDISRSILLQIILEEEAAGMPMFSTQVLAQIIRFYGHTMQGMMGSYLERNVQSFIDMQNKLTENPLLNMTKPMQSYLSTYTEQSKQMFTQMQEHLTKQAQTFMGNLASGVPGKKPTGK